MIEDNKHEFKQSFDSYYKNHKLRFLYVPLLISCGFVFFIDYNFNLNIFVYFFLLLISVIIALRVYKNKLLRRLVNKGMFCHQYNLLFRDDLIQIRIQDQYLSYRIKDCQFSFVSHFLVIVTPTVIENQKLTSQIFIAKAETQEWMDFAKLKIHQDDRRIINKRNLPKLLLLVSVLLLLFKISETALNNFIYSDQEIWSIARMSTINDFPTVTDTSNYSYIQLDNTKSAYDVFNQNKHIVCIRYRYLPFGKLRFMQMSASGSTPDFAHGSNGFYDTYNLIKNEKSMVLVNDKYKIYLIKTNK